MAIGWPFTGNAKDLEEPALRDLLVKQYPTWDSKRIGNSVGCIRSFTTEMDVGDLVLVVPKKSDFDGYVMLAEITGDYEFDTALAGGRNGYPHQRPVRWVRPRISRKQLPEQLTDVLGRRGITLLELPPGLLRDHAAEKEWINQA